MSNYDLTRLGQGNPIVSGTTKATMTSDEIKKRLEGIQRNFPHDLDSLEGGRWFREAVIRLTLTMNELVKKHDKLKARNMRIENLRASEIDCLNTELRENYGSRYQITSTLNDLRPAIRALVDGAKYTESLEQKSIIRDFVKEFDELKARVGKMQTALTEIKNPDWGIGGGKAVRGNTELSGCEEFYKGYNGGIETQFSKTADIAMKALADAKETQDG